LAGDGPAATNSAAASADTCRETADGGGDPGHLGPIPSRGRKRAARGTCRAHRGSLGRRRTAAGGDGRGGHVGRARGREAEEGKSTQEREGKEGSGRGTYPLVQRVGGGHLLARSTAGALPGSCLPTEEDDEDRSWAGPCWAVICCTQAAGKRERRKDLGQIRPGEKERRKGTLFLFVFSFYFLFSKLLHYFEFTQGLKPSL
jgi:hypothetical protein